jgi:hypothetical protein
VLKKNRIQRLCLFSDKRKERKNVAVQGVGEE